MRKLLVSALVVAALGVGTPARVAAQDAATVAGVLVGLTVLGALARSGEDGRGTSNNTEYAMTGKGVPEMSSRQEAIWSKGNVSACCFGRVGTVKDD